MADEDKTVEAPKKAKPKKPQRIAIVDARGNVAQPFEKDLDAWLAKGWRLMQPD